MQAGRMGWDMWVVCMCAHMAKAETTVGGRHAGVTSCTHTRTNTLVNPPSKSQLCSVITLNLCFLLLIACTFQVKHDANTYYEVTMQCPVIREQSLVGH